MVSQHRHPEMQIFSGVCVEIAIAPAPNKIKQGCTKASYRYTPSFGYLNFCCKGRVPRWHLLIGSHAFDPTITCD
jgi:hypothetical protein